MTSSSADEQASLFGADLYNMLETGDVSMTLRAGNGSGTPGQVPVLVEYSPESPDETMTDDPSGSEPRSAESGGGSSEPDPSSTSSPRLTSSPEGSPAGTSPSPGADEGSTPREPRTEVSSSSSSPDSPMSLFDQEDGSSLRTSPACSVPPVDEISRSFYGRWATSGFTTSPGECWTAVASEFPRDAVASSSLRDVLLEDVHETFSLSQRSAEGILRRSSARGKVLPPRLEEALRQISASSAEE